IVNWPLTHPARAARGYVISDFFDEAATSPLRLADAEAGAPTTAVEIARAAFDVWQAKSWPEIFPGAVANAPPPDGWRWAQWDRAYGAAAADLEQQFAPRVTAVRFQALDIFGHLGLREAQPELFGLFAGGTHERSTLDRYYTYLDGEAGRAMAALEELRL